MPSTSDTSTAEAISPDSFPARSNSFFQAASRLKKYESRGNVAFLYVDVDDIAVAELGLVKADIGPLEDGQEIEIF